MNRTFRRGTPDQSWLFPPSPQDWLPENHLVDFLLDVSPQIDMAPIVDDDASDQGGQPPDHPRRMLVLLLDSYCVGVFSSRKIMARCETDVAFRVLVGEDIPDFRRISEFRKRQLERMQPLFIAVLKLCREAGLLKVGRLALDGTQVKANASRHKAMSDDRMTSEEQRLEQEIAELLQQAQAADASEDTPHGDQRGDELPDEPARRAQRLEKIRAANAALASRARQKATEHAAQLESAGRTPRTNPDEAVPKPKDQRNFTDPESKIMKTSHQGFDPWGHAQAVANADQIILSADVTDQANHVRQAEPLVKQTLEHLDAAGVDEPIRAFTADAGRPDHHHSRLGLRGRCAGRGESEGGRGSAPPRRKPHDCYPIRTLITPGTENGCIPKGYGPDLVKLEPRHSPETEERRRMILEAERPFIERFEYANTWGHAFVRVTGDRIRASMFRGLDRKAWKELDLTGPLATKN